MNIFNLFKSQKTASREINRITIKEGFDVKIGQPAIYPTEMTDSLKELFSKKAKVYNAYLAWMKNPATSEPAHYVFAIDTDEEWDGLMAEAASVITTIVPLDEMVDFIKMDDSGWINDYFRNKTTPFYQKPS